MKLLKCKNITIAYENSIAVKNVTFSVEQGDYLCILGENGSGKSSLIKGILGIEKLKSGEVILADNMKKQDIGYLPQQTIIQKDFPASVYEVVLSGCLNHKKGYPFYTKEQKQIAQENMKKLNIDSIKNESYRELSGGQQQRVLLARALCATRRMLILDEPISGLDPKVTKQMYRVIKEVNTQGITIIMVSHDVQFAIQHANKIIHMTNKLEFFGTTEEYKKSKIGQTFLGGGRHE